MPSYVVTGASRGIGVSLIVSMAAANRYIY